VADDIRLKLGFPHHRKTLNLRAMLGPEGPWHLVILWTKMAEQRPKGILTGMDETAIGLEAEWPGRADEFVQALMTCGGPAGAGFLERGEDGVYSLHDWEEHQRFIFFAPERSEAARKNVEKRYQKAKENSEVLPSVDEKVTNSKPSEGKKVTPIPSPSPSPVPVPFPSEKAVTEVTREKDKEERTPRVHTGMEALKAILEQKGIVVPEVKEEKKPEPGRQPSMTREQSIQSIRDLKAANTNPKVIRDAMKKYKISDNDLRSAPQEATTRCAKKRAGGKSGRKQNEHPGRNDKGEGTEKKGAPSLEAKTAAEYFCKAVEKEKGFVPQLVTKDFVQANQAVKKLSFDQIKAQIDFFLSNGKSNEHITLAAALSADTYNLCMAQRRGKREFAY
jgi:hypothetical protein